MYVINITCSKYISCSHTSYTESLSFFAEEEDYTLDSTPAVINIRSGMSRGCLTITVVSSDLAEDAESIYLTINKATTKADVMKEGTVVVINCDGGM